MLVFEIQNTKNFVFFLGLFPTHFLSISNSNFRRLGLPNRCFHMEGIANMDFFMEIVFEEFRHGFLVFFFDALGAVFLVF